MCEHHSSRKLITQHSKDQNRKMLYRVISRERIQLQVSHDLSVYGCYTLDLTLLLSFDIFNLGDSLPLKTKEIQRKIKHFYTSIPLQINAA